MIFSQNHRAKLQLTQVTYLDYIRHRRIGKHYVLTETMCKGGLKYPVVPHYSVNKDGIVVYSLERIFDNVFLPNIFHFPYAPALDTQEKGYASSLILAGLRILQLIRIFHSNKEDCLNDNRLRCNDIVEACFNIFRYDKIIIQNILLLLHDFRPFVNSFDLN